MSSEKLRLLGFPADRVCDGGATHQHTGHDSGAVRGAETGSDQTAAPVSQPVSCRFSFVQFNSVAVVQKRFILICCATFWEPLSFSLSFLLLQTFLKFSSFITGT